MKRLSRDFTRGEKALLLLLALILLGLTYYLVVDRPVRAALESARAEKEAIRTELTTLQGRIARMEKMEQERNAIRANPGVSQMGSYNKPRGYYFDQLEQLNSPIFIVISAGTQTRTGGELKIKDLGMQGSKLVIVVEETKAAGDKYTGLDCPTAALEVDHAPSEVLIVSTKGEQFKKIEA